MGGVRDQKFEFSTNNYAETCVWLTSELTHVSINTTSKSIAMSCSGSFSGPVGVLCPLTGTMCSPFLSALDPVLQGLRRGRRVCDRPGSPGQDGHLWDKVRVALMPCDMLILLPVVCVGLDISGELWRHRHSFLTN